MCVTQKRGYAQMVTPNVKIDQQAIDKNKKHSKSKICCSLECMPVKHLQKKR